MNEPMYQDSELFAARRALLKGVGVAAALVASGAVSQAVAAADEHAHHHPMVDNGRNGLIDSAMACIKSGEACNAHCLELFKAGDTSVAGCAASVQEMLAACTALTKLAAYNSRHLKATVQLCMSVCEDCEKECRKHEKEHIECKTCADSCLDCIKLCKVYLA